MADATSPAIVITGASGGIGEALAYEFARERPILVLVARSGEGLSRVAIAAKERGAPRVETVPLDLAKPEAVDDLEQALQALGLHVETLVNNAGYGLKGAFADMAEDATLGIVDLNIRALTLLCRRFLPGMIARRKGGIVNLASTAAFAPGPMMAVYHASKSYVLSFSRALAAEVRDQGVIVTAICPGITVTGFQARAKLEGTRVTKMRGIEMSAEAVAALGYRGFRAGKPMVVTGAMNKVTAFSARLAPPALQLAAARFLYDRG
jgi:hypothetical protein